MKKVVFALSFLAASVSMADVKNLTCKERTSAPGQGYEAITEGDVAVVLLNGKKVASLYLDRENISTYQQIAVYQQNVANGYSLQVSAGGTTGMTSMRVSKGGFRGYDSVALLNDCK